MIRPDPFPSFKGPSERTGLDRPGVTPPGSDTYRAW
jgi:hypothetical protein